MTPETAIPILMPLDDFHDSHRAIPRWPISCTLSYMAYGSNKGEDGRARQKGGRRWPSSPLRVFRPET
jgi:hypothetical protein